LPPHKCGDADYALTIEIYVEVSIADENLADQVWDAWDVGGVEYPLAASAWFAVAQSNVVSNTLTVTQSDHSSRMDWK